MISGEEYYGRLSASVDLKKMPVGSIVSQNLIEEVATLKGATRVVHRLYAQQRTGYRGVGWIVDEDIDFCMICCKNFTLFFRQHHCRACGNIVCDDCSPNYFLIEEMHIFGPQRVCFQCYWGQVGIMRQI